jgi:GGDEF domain-containing protein
MRPFLPLIIATLALSNRTALASPVQIDASSQLIQMQARIDTLEWQVIALSSALFSLLALLGAWQFYKKRRLRILSMTDELTKLPNRKHILTTMHTVNSL